MTASLACDTRGGIARFAHEGRWSDGRIYAAVKDWAGRDAELVHRRREHTLVLTVAGGTALTGNAISSTLRYEGIDRTGSISYVPAGAERRGWYRDADMRFVALVIAPELAPARELPAFANRRDRVLEAVLRDLARELADGPVPTSRAEYAADVAMARLARIAGRVERDRRSALSPRDLARIRELVDAELDRDLSIGELATAIGLSPDRFARRFAATVGVPPHQFLLECRVRRAQSWLAEPRRRLADIALGLGFASQSHFTTVFRRRVGVPPAVWRRRHGIPVS